MNKSKTILVVEDDIELCNAILSALHGEGYAPTGVISSREAIFKLKNQQFACVVLDMRLGQDSGADLINFIRTRDDVPNSTVPILVISGFLDRELVEKIKMQIQGALVKPFGVQQLVDNVARIIR